MANPAQVLTYKPRIWKTYEVEMDSPEMPEMKAEQRLDPCLSDSKFAQENPASPKLFLWDLECATAGIESEKGKCPGGELRRLAADWKGHKKGDLAMFVFYERALLSQSITLAVADEQKAYTT